MDWNKTIYFCISRENHDKLRKSRSLENRAPNFPYIWGYGVHIHARKATRKVTSSSSEMEGWAVIGWKEKIIFS